MEEKKDKGLESAIDYVASIPTKFRPSGPTYDPKPALDSFKYLIDNGVDKPAALILGINIIGQVGYVKPGGDNNYNNFIKIYKGLLEKEYSPIESAFLIKTKLENPWIEDMEQTEQEFNHIKTNLEKILKNTAK